MSDKITLIDGWTWHVGGSSSPIPAGQYDFQTILTHELGHALGLGHSDIANSVMNSVLSDAEARRELSGQDLTLLQQHEDHAGPAALLAKGFETLHDFDSHSDHESGIDHQALDVIFAQWSQRNQANRSPKQLGDHRIPIEVVFEPVPDVRRQKTEHQHYAAMVDSLLTLEQKTKLDEKMQEMPDFLVNELAERPFRLEP